MRSTSSPWRLIAIVFAAVVVLLISILLASQPRSTENLYEKKVIPPSCVDNGYTLFTHKINGSTYVDHIVPAVGHSYGTWQQNTAQLLVTRKTRACSVCGYLDSQVDYPTLSIPTLVLSGDLAQIGKTNAVSVSAAFYGEEEFALAATLKYQGHSTLNYDKKNYTLKLFADEARTEKYKLTFEHWNPENKYILKANFIDSSQCRNLVCANIWADVVASRENLPEPMRHLSNYGAVDGFPIALYINEAFQGIYTLNLHKDEDLFGMQDGRDQAIVIANTDTSDEAFFRAPATFRENSPWEVEYCGTADDQWVKDKFNELITFVMESDDDTFQNDLHQYLDVQSAIDYLICVYALGLPTHGADEMLLVCYGRDEPWILSMYDMETGFGLSADGTACVGPEEFLPSNEFGSWDSATGSLLWDRMLQLYFPEIQSRYRELRQSVLEPQHMLDRACTMMESIGTTLYEADHQVFPQPNSQLDHLDQITQYIYKRIELLDQIFLTQIGASS